MLGLLENVEFWKALAALLWPILAILVFFSAREKIYAFLSRDNLSIKVGGMEISVADATKSLGTAVADLQKRLAEIEATLTTTGAGISETTDSTSAVPKPKTEIKFASKTFPLQSFAILWVDDYPSNNAFLIDQLQKDGIEVKLALSTIEGLKDFKNASYDLIITDLGRKENGRNNPFAGLDLINQIRAQAPKLPILVYAGERGLQNQDKLIRAGATKVTESAIDVQSFINNLRAQLDLTSETLRTSSPESAR